MESVKTIEDEIARQRYTYNNIAQQFNTMLDTIPSNIVGMIIGLIKLEYLKFEERPLRQDQKLSFKRKSWQKRNK